MLERNFSLRRQRPQVRILSGAPKNLNVSRALVIAGFSGNSEHCSFAQPNAGTCSESAYIGGTIKNGLFQ